MVGPFALAIPGLIAAATAAFGIPAYGEIKRNQRQAETGDAISEIQSLVEQGTDPRQAVVDAFKAGKLNDIISREDGQQRLQGLMELLQPQATLGPGTQVQDTLTGQVRAGAPTTEVQTLQQLGIVGGLTPDEFQSVARAALAQSAKGTTSSTMEKFQLYKSLGLSDEASTKYALGAVKVFQYANPFTGQAFPMLIDITKGGAIGYDQAGTKTVLSPEQVQQAQAQGILTSPDTNGIGEDTGAGGPQVGQQAPLPPEIENRMSAFLADNPIASTDMPLSEAAFAAGPVPSITRALGSIVAPIAPERQREDLISAQNSINALRVQASVYTRAAVGTSRLAGIGEVNQFLELFPDTNFWTSPKENLTKMLGLWNRLEDWSREDRKTVTNQSASVQIRLDAEARIEISDRILDLMGSRQELEQALQKTNDVTYIQKFQRIGEVLSGARAHLGEAGREALGAASEGLAGKAPEADAGIPAERFNQLLANGGRGLTAEEANALSAIQYRKLRSVMFPDEGK